ncbi:MAG: hypothetical protein ABTR54_07765, partial [Candidatus Competibacter sp.]
RDLARTTPLVAHAGHEIAAEAGCAGHEIAAEAGCAGHEIAAEAGCAGHETATEAGCAGQTFNHGQNDTRAACCGHSECIVSVGRSARTHTAFHQTGFFGDRQIRAPIDPP